MIISIRLHQCYFMVICFYYLIFFNCTKVYKIACRNFIMKTTENRNPVSKNIDLMSSFDIIKIINEEDKNVASAVQKCLPEIAKAVDLIIENFQKGGRLFYFGAGTSGRIGVLDASECWPTFGVDHGMIVGVIAGGDNSLRYSIESTEDLEENGITDLMNLSPTTNDTVVGLSASGNTKYVLSVLKHAQKLGLKTIGYSSNKNAKLAQYCDVFINPIVGAEILTGSTRMKSGSAQKMVLNMLSTTSMIRLGKTYENLMIDVRTVNEKLRDRACRIISDISGVSYDIASDLLNRAQAFIKDNTRGVPLAVIMATKNCSAQQASLLLRKHAGIVRNALSD